MEEDVKITEEAVEELEENAEEVQDEFGVQTTFNESTVEDLIDEEGSVENVQD